MLRGAVFTEQDSWPIRLDRKVERYLKRIGSFLRMHGTVHIASKKKLLVVLEAFILGMVFPSLSGFLQVFVPPSWSSDMWIELIQ